MVGLCAPKGAPDEIVATLNREINAALADPALRERLADLGGAPLALSPAEFAARVSAEIDKWSKVIRAANIRPA